jgi:putative thioredoxin
MLANDTVSTGTEDLVKDTTTKDFMVDVVQESRAQPVLVDFWAPWCGPCKQLTPVIEKAVREAGGRVKLVKMNIDEHPAIAGQLGIQSIPAVIAFSNGQPVDGFMGAVPEGQIKDFIDRLGAPAAAADTAALLEAAEAALGEGALAEAAEIYAGLLGQDPQDVRSLAGIARVQLAAGNVEAARQALADVPTGKENDPAIAAVRAQIELADRSVDTGELAALQARAEAAPEDLQAQHDYAVALAGAERREEALDILIGIVARDRTWNEDGARRQLVQLFEAWGPMDPATIQGRRRLSSILFA